MDDAIIERVIAAGDLKQLKPEERNSYYLAVCRSLSLNPLTRPLEYITLTASSCSTPGRIAPEQLRKLHGVSIVKLETNTVDGVFEAMAYAKRRTAKISTSAPFRSRAPRVMHWSTRS